MFGQSLQAADILHDDYGESDDNLSIRTLNMERESSPMSSAVSPIGSLNGDSEPENSGIDEELLGASSSIIDPSR